MSSLLTKTKYNLPNEKNDDKLNKLQINKLNIMSENVKLPEFNVNSISNPAALVSEAKSKNKTASQKFAEQHNLIKVEVAPKIGTFDEIIALREEINGVKYSAEEIEKQKKELTNLTPEALNSTLNTCKDQVEHDRKYGRQDKDTIIETPNNDEPIKIPSYKFGDAEYFRNVTKTEI